MLSKVVVGLVMLGFVVALVGAAGMVSATKGEGGDFHKKHPNGRCEDRYFPNYPPEGQGWEPGRCPEETPEPTEEPTEEPEETQEPTTEVTPEATDTVDPTQEPTEVVEPSEEPEETQVVEPTQEATEATPTETQEPSLTEEPEETETVVPTEPAGTEVPTESPATELPTEPAGTEVPTEPINTEVPVRPTEISPAPAVQSAPPLCTDAFGPFLKVAAGELSWYFVTGGWIDGSFYLNEASYALGGTLTEEDPYMAGNYSLVLCQNVTILFKVHGELAGIARIQNAVVTDAYILANGLLVFKPMAHQQ